VPTRVSIDVSAVPASPAGAGRYTLDVVAALGRRDDVALTLVSRRDDAARWDEVAPGARMVAAAPGRRPARLAWEQMRLPAVLGGLEVDLHHGPHYTMPERAKVPKVVTVHDLTFFDHPEWHERAKVPFFRRAIRVAARHADAVVCVSRATADRLAERLAPTAPVHIVPHGVDHARFTPAGDLDVDSARLAALGVRAPYVLFVGTVEPRKDVPALVRAFDRMAGHHREIGLVIAGGPGWGRAAVDRAVAEARHAERILRTGYVPDDAVPALLRSASAVAYPSLEEGFGLPALEALACGAPLVTTTGSAMEEVAEGAALLVPPADVDALAGALDMVVRGDEGLATRRRRGLEIAARHTWAASAAGHVEVYRSLL
jgi:glycosyltransferase involved in cell wall biosynthesis